MAAVSLGVALISAWSGGWQAQLFGLTVSVRALWRPLLLSALAIAFRLWLLRRDSRRASAWSASLAGVIAGGIVTAAVLGWLTYLAPYVGGADSYGYVSASDRILRGTLVEHETLAPLLPNPQSAIPLGYVPAARVPNASAPAYPLGLPAIMAIASIVFGTPGPFYVAMVMGLALLATTYAIIARALLDHVVALTAVSVLAMHPLVFAYSIQPMSDVPAAACFLAAAWCLLHESRVVAFVGGVAAALAFAIRPALLPAVGTLTLIPLLARSPGRTVFYLMPLAIAILFQAWLHSYLYGSARASGYGTADVLFSLSYLTGNARSYAYWGILLHGPIWITGLIVGLWHLRHRGLWLTLVAAVVGALLPYAIYRTYDHWETLRFLMPLVAVTTLIAVSGLFTGARRLIGHVQGTWVALALAIAIVATSVRWLDRHHVFMLAYAQERFSGAGNLVARATSLDAVVAAALHSGSLRYYASRDTLDWSKVPSSQFEATVTALRKDGRPVFVMLDGAEEEAQFDALHGNEADRNRWLPAGQYRDVRLYELP